MNCADCKKKPLNKCSVEGHDCIGGKLDLSMYGDKENFIYQNLSDKLRCEYGNSLTRLEEISGFSKSAGFKKIGLAFCIGLKDEARVVAGILEQKFKVDSVCCKMSGLDKDEHQMTKINPEKKEIACNPIGQAMILNRSKTDLNVQMGLCLGHDILFNKYSEAPVTVLVVKDRALANNPMGVVYCSYWRQKLIEDKG